jgi:hypothetical protein
LGKLACLVCSKILGIGSAERSWGDVKHLKTDKRSKLSGEATKMQGTIFGASCAARARLQEEGRDRGAALHRFWDDDDFANPGLDVTSIQGSTAKKQRIFRAWIEDWEMVAKMKQDPVNEAALLQKYGGLMWIDPDTQNKFMASRDFLTWNPMRGAGKGYCVKGLNDTHDPTDPDDDDWEPWILDPDLLHPLIVQYYEINPDSNLRVVTLEEKEGQVE